MKWDYKRIQEEFFQEINSLSRRIDELAGKADIAAHAMEIDQLLGKILLLEYLINDVALLSRQAFIASMERHSVIDIDVKDSRIIDVIRVKHAYHMEASCLREFYAKGLRSETGTSQNP